METLAYEKQIDEYVKMIEKLKKQNKNDHLFCTEVRRFEKKLEQLKHKVCENLTSWQRIQICRHPDRPHAIDYIHNLCNQFQELSGDRAFGNDRSIIGGLAVIGDMKCMVIAQEKGSDTESRLDRNFGMPHPEGYRKALRLMQLAEKFSLPIVTLLDTPGAYPGLEAEERGQGWAIAKNLREMARITTPIITVLIGEGCSGGALGMGIGDRMGMLEHAYYAVISPEGCASILWKDAEKKEEAAVMLKLTAEDLLEAEVVDEIIYEPLGGAHRNPEEVYENVKQYILSEWEALKVIPAQLLVEQRYLKFRKLGKYQTKSEN